MKIVKIITRFYGSIDVTIKYRNKLYTAMTTNTLATDRIMFGDKDNKRKKEGGYTYKQAERWLIDHVLSANGVN